MTCSTIIEVVRDAAGELPDRFHLLRLAQLRFGRRPFGDDGRNALFQHLVGLAQNVFGFLAVLDVDDRADIAAKFTIIRKTRPGRTQSPAIASVLAPQTILDPKRCARRIGIDEDALRLLAIVGMHGVPCTGIQRLFLRLPRELGPETGSGR